MDKKKILHSGLKNLKWTTLGTIIPQIINPLLSIWLALILDPSAYGIIAIASIFIGFSKILQGIGFGEYIVKSKFENKPEIDTAFWGNLIFGCLTFLIFVLITPIIVAFYEIEQLEIVFPIISISIIFNSIGFVQNTILIKRMLFKKIFIIQIIPIFILISSTIPLAYLGYGVWALVIGTLLNSFLSNLLYWLYSDYRPSIYFSLKKFKKMFDFGKWILFQKKLEYLNGSIDIIIMGIFFNETIIGLYSVGKNFVKMIFTSINGPIGAIILPMASKLKHAGDDISKLYVKIFKKILLINMPLMIGIFFISENLIELIFQEKWLGLGTIVSLLVIGEGIQRNFWLQREIFQVLGKPEIYPKIVLISLIISVPLFYFFNYENILNFCYIYILICVISSILHSIAIIKELKIIILNFLKKISPILLSSFIMGLLLFLFTHNEQIIYLDGLLKIFITVIVSIIIYITSLIIIDKKEIYQIYESIKKIF